MSKILSDAEWLAAIDSTSAKDYGERLGGMVAVKEDRSALLGLLKRSLKVAKRWYGSCCPDPSNTCSHDDNRCSDCLELAELIAALEGQKEGGE